MCFCELEISGTDKDVIDIMTRARLIESLLREHKLMYKKYFSYDGCKEIRYNERRIYNQASEFIVFCIEAPQEMVDFIWHLYSSIYSQMLYISASFRERHGW